MLSIKECCRYINFLRSMTIQIEGLFNCDEYIYNIKEVHHRSQACVNGKDEEILKDQEKEFNIELHNALFLIKDLLDEQTKVSLTIENAKRKLVLPWIENESNLTLDTALELNKSIHSLTNNLNFIKDYKSKEVKTIGTDYTFNQEGNQVPYKYSLERIYTINFDRKVILDQYKKLLSKADEISSQIDEAMMKKVVDIEFKYSIHDSLEDIINNFLAK